MNSNSHLCWLIVTSDLQYCNNTHNKSNLTDPQYYNNTHTHTNTTRKRKKTANKQKQKQQPMSNAKISRQQKDAQFICWQMVHSQMMCSIRWTDDGWRVLRSRMSDGCAKMDGDGRWMTMIPNQEQWFPSCHFVCWFLKPKAVISSFEFCAVDTVLLKQYRINLLIHWSLTAFFFSFFSVFSNQNYGSHCVTERV